MHLGGMRFMKVTPLRISVEGQWSAGPHRDWRGWANATEPFDAITFLSTPTDCNWSKSERGEMPREVRLTLGSYDKQGREVQVNFSVAGGYQLGRSCVPSLSYRPGILSQREFSTSTVSFMDRCNLLAAKNSWRPLCRGVFHPRSGPQTRLGPRCLFSTENAKVLNACTEMSSMTSTNHKHLPPKRLGAIQ